MNWYIVIFLFQVSTATDGFYRPPIVHDYEWVPKPFVDKAACEAAATQGAIDRNAARPLIAPPNGAFQYAGACVQI